MAQSVITRDDLIRVGACVDSVNEWVTEHAPHATALKTKLALATCQTDYEKEYIRMAAGLSGYGYGSYGEGTHYGDGYGNGSVYGNSYGGDGHGIYGKIGGGDYGHGNGYGNGYGEGYSVFSGDGDGNGSSYE